MKNFIENIAQNGVFISIKVEDGGNLSSRRRQPFQPRRRRGRHEGATSPPLQNTPVKQRLNGFAHGGPAQIVGLAQMPLRWNFLAATVDAVKNVLFKTANQSLPAIVNTRIQIHNGPQSSGFLAFPGLR
ncbi:hypothetical protein SDC9_115647 [bioreactor metagenome]|uniref:Uncharacterized protein n=1 Tax=bioreactor metagenome TaxID=1076179 RepID=A0A645C050_9ZZZZ